MPLRFLCSLGVAICVVSALLWLALEISGFAGRDAGPVLETYAVDLLSAAERRELQDMLGEGRPERAPPMSAPTAIAPLDRAREVHGMVRLDVDVDARGQVSAVRVIDASPAGVYEAQAIAEVRRRRFSPDILHGRAVASRRLEIVDFVITPAPLAAVEGE